MKQETLSDLEYSCRMTRLFTATQGNLVLQKRPEIQPDAHLSAIEHRINRRSRSLPEVSDDSIDWKRYIENSKSSVRCRVEWIFRFIKCQFGNAFVQRLPRIAIRYEKPDSSFRLLFALPQLPF